MWLFILFFMKRLFFFVMLQLLLSSVFSQIKVRQILDSAYESPLIVLELYDPGCPSLVTTRVYPKGLKYRVRVEPYFYTGKDSSTSSSFRLIEIMNEPQNVRDVVKYYEVELKRLKRFAAVQKFEIKDSTFTTILYCGEVEWQNRRIVACDTCKKEFQLVYPAHIDLIRIQKLLEAAPQEYEEFELAASEKVEKLKFRPEFLQLFRPFFSQDLDMVRAINGWFEANRLVEESKK